MKLQDKEKWQEELIAMPRHKLENLAYCLLRARAVDGRHGRTFDAIELGHWERLVETGWCLVPEDQLSTYGDGDKDDSIKIHGCPFCQHLAYCVCE